MLVIGDEGADSALAFLSLDASRLILRESVVWSLGTCGLLSHQEPKPKPAMEHGAINV